MRVHSSFLEGCLKEVGFDLSKTRFVHDFATPMIAECFAGGWGDLIVVDPLTASKLVMDGKGYLAGSLAEYGGAVPWSVYYSPIMSVTTLIIWPDALQLPYSVQQPGLVSMMLPKLKMLLRKLAQC